MFDELWSEIQDAPGEIFDLDRPVDLEDGKPFFNSPEEVESEELLNQIYQAERECSDYGVGK